jgi:hypothetical protein
MYPPQQPLYAQQLLPGWEHRTQGRNGGIGGSGGGDGGSGTGDGPFTEAFDFSFSTYASLRLVKMVYIFLIVMTALAYVGSAIPMLFLIPPFGIGILAVGWIPALFMILAGRVGLEVTLATVRTAIDARALRTRYVGPVTVE